MFLIQNEDTNKSPHAVENITSVFFFEKLQSLLDLAHSKLEKQVESNTVSDSINQAPYLIKLFSSRQILRSV